MNSIDAGSTYCNIKLDAHRLSIADDGKGFVDRTEIEDFFETFGHPHEEGDARVGRFRMGRGQLFAAGANKWVSNRFVMDVDLKPQEKQASNDFSLGYTLLEVPEAKAVKGCSINVRLYDPMNNWLLGQTQRAIAESVAWAQIPVTLNGKLVSVSPADREWDFDTDEAYISLKKTGQLQVYNLGVLVCSLPASSHGTGGTIVSKERLDVNFARNAVQSTCPVWKKILKVISKEVNKDVAKSKKLDDAGREMLARSLVDGGISMSEALSHRLITDVTGSHRQLKTISPSGWADFPVTVAPTGDRVGDVVMQRKLALVLSQDTLDRFGSANLKELLAVLESAARKDLAVRGVKTNEWTRVKDPVREFLNGIQRLKPVEMGPFRATITQDHLTVDPKDLRRAEVSAIEAVQASAYVIHGIMAEWCKRNNLPVPTSRRVSVGSSETANGWTDGVDNIWIERGLLPNARTPAGCNQLASLLVHEFLHREPDTGTHVHDVDFYQQFHELVMRTDVIIKGANRITGLLDARATREERTAKPEAEIIGPPPANDADPDEAEPTGMRL